MHYHHIDDEDGNLCDLVPFCSDSCHRDWCEAHKVPYNGWNGANEGSDSPEFCAYCGVYAGGGYDCDHQLDNVVVNRFLSDDGERCDCGHWLQLPASYLD